MSGVYFPAVINSAKEDYCALWLNRGSFTGKSEVGKENSNTAVSINNMHAKFPVDWCLMNQPIKQL